MLATGLERVVSTEGVLGGKACIKGTRIPVWVLQQCRNLGMTDNAILEDYPELERGDLEAAWLYVENNRTLIKDQSQRNEER